MVLRSKGWDVMYKSRFLRPPDYNRRANLKKYYEPWMKDGLIKHLESGGSFQSFSGVIPMSIANWHRIGQDVKEIKELRDRYNYLKLRQRKFSLSVEIPNREIYDSQGQ